MTMCDAVFPFMRTGMSAPLLVTHTMSFAFADKPANSFLQPIKNKQSRKTKILAQMHFIRVDSFFGSRNGMTVQAITDTCLYGKMKIKKTIVWILEPRRRSEFKEPRIRISFVYSVVE